MNFKLIGGTLLIIGTTIGAGMLALPIATAQMGFWGSTGLLIGCWLIMTTCSLLILEVNLWLPPNSNLISMAGATLGWPAQVLAWVAYLVMLYSILCAYISGGADIFKYILALQGIYISASQASLLFTILFGAVVYFGIKSVDYVNRSLMFGKLSALFILLLLILPFASSHNFNPTTTHQLLCPAAISVAAVAFASGMIIPSLRTYFHDDVTMLRKVIIVGTFIPLLCYIAWNLAIMGVVPFSGDHGLQRMMVSGSSNSDLLSSISLYLQKESIHNIAKFFTSICMATSFLGISLSLSDFVADGLKVPKTGRNNLIIFAATYLPPITIVLFWPSVFMKGLSYAGISAIVLMVLYPPLMAWSGRYLVELAPAEAAYRVRGGKLLLLVLLIFATLLTIYGIESIL